MSESCPARSNLRIVSFEDVVIPGRPARYPFTFSLVSCCDVGKARPVPGVTPTRASVRPSARDGDLTPMRSDYFLNLIEPRALLVRPISSWSFVHVSMQMFPVIGSFRFQTEVARRTIDRETGTKERPSLCPQARNVRRCNGSRAEVR